VRAHSSGALYTWQQLPPRPYALDAGQMVLDVHPAWHGGEVIDDDDVVVLR
jgi:hypothetical protein